MRALAWLALPLSRRAGRRLLARRGDRRLFASVYDQPALYDAAFGFRDFVDEVDFLFAAHAKHGRTGGPPASVLELAAGPARHAVEAAARGAACAAVDSSEAMRDYGIALATAEGVDVAYAVGDVRDEVGGPVETAWLLLGSLGHLLDADDAVTALGRARDALVPGGTLFLELPHPRETFRLDDVGEDAWIAPLAGGAGDVRVAWGDDDDAFDALTQVRSATVTFEVVRDGAVASSLTDVVPTREFTLQELLLLARLAGGFDATVATYGGMDLEIAADDDELAYRLVVVLTKAGGAPG